ncbi:hypothetical protein [Shuttleworthella sp. MSX8B]|nr:hypothetical protein [Shuttleworthia sp. MSX8B]
MSKGLIGAASLIKEYRAITGFASLYPFATSGSSDMEASLSPGIKIQSVI